MAIFRPTSKEEARHGPPTDCLKSKVVKDIVGEQAMGLCGALWKLPFNSINIAYNADQN